MNDSPISTAVRSLIQRHINSVEQLEVFLLLFRRQDRAWDSTAVSAELRTSVVSASKRLEDLARSRLIHADGIKEHSFRFDPTRVGYALRVVEDLDVCYRRYRIRIIELIFSRKGAALGAFLDAFQIGQEDDE